MGQKIRDYPGKIFTLRSEITMKQRKDLEATVKQIRDNRDYAVIRYNKLITTQLKNLVNRKKEFQHEGIEVHD